MCALAPSQAVAMAERGGVPSRSVMRSNCGEKHTHTHTHTHTPTHTTHPPPLHTLHHVLICPETDTPPLFTSISLLLSKLANSITFHLNGFFASKCQELHSGVSE